MNQNRVFSETVYQVEVGKIKNGDRTGKRNEYLILDTVNTDKHTIGKEKTPKKNGMQAMVVAEIKDKYKGYDKDDLKKQADYPKSVIKKDLTIAYAGTKNWQDWKTNIREVGFEDKHDNGAFQLALAYADAIEKTYSVKDGYTISTTGHSLGGAQAIYVAVLKGYHGFTYAAAGPGLSEKQLMNYEGQIINLYDTSDIVTSGWLTGGKGQLPFHSFGIDNAGWKNYGHDLNQFNLDKNGNYIDKYGDIVIYSDQHGGVALEQTLLAQQIIKNKAMIRQMETYGEKNQWEKDRISQLKEENKWLQLQISAFSKLVTWRKRFTASSGGLSTNEQIYLDDQQALMIVKHAASVFNQAMEQVLVIYQRGIRDLEQLWPDGLAMVRRQTPLLSQNEMLDALREVGCTKQTIVDEPTQEFREKKSSKSSSFQQNSLPWQKRSKRKSMSWSNVIGTWHDNYFKTRSSEMEKENQIHETYRKERLQLEDQEDQLRQMQKNMQQLAETTYSNIRFSVRSFECSKDSLYFAQKELRRLEERFSHELMQKRKKIYDQQDEVERRYRADLQRLNKK